MNTGRLDRKVSIQTYVTTRSQFGEAVKTWVEDSSRWCSFESKVSASAAFGNPDIQGQPVLRSVGMFTFRNNPAVFKQDFRIEFDGEYWHPLQIAKKGTRNEWTLVMAEAFDSSAQEDSTNIVPGTNKTIDELVAFFNEFGNASEPEIQYMQVPVFASDPDLYQDEFEAAGVMSFQSHLTAGSYETKEVSNILHIARLDTTVPLNRQGQVLRANNAFGNTWRFTFDDGTRYHPYMSAARSYADITSRSSEVGYTGNYPAYCIDNLTGLAVNFATPRRWFNNSSSYNDSSPDFDYYDPAGWWSNAADQSSYSSAYESDLDYFNDLDGRTIQGHSDWRLANLNEVNVLMLSTQDNNIHTGSGNEELQAELGVTNEATSTGTDAIEFWDRAEEGIPHAPWYSIRDSALHIILQGPINFSSFAFDDDGNTSSSAGVRYYAVRSVAGTNSRSFNNFTGAYYWMPIMVRRHFGNNG